MEFMVLGLLFFGEMTIYELNNNFKRGLSLIYSASYGSLQNAVKKLLKAEKITFRETVEGGRNKKYYAVNDTGRQAFSQWMLGESPLNKLETTMLSKVYFLGLVESPEDQKKVLAELIEKAEGVTGELMAYDESLQDMEIPEEAMGIAKYQMSTLNYGVRSHGVAVDWLKELYEGIEG